MKKIAFKRYIQDENLKLNSKDTCSFKTIKFCAILELIISFDTKTNFISNIECVPLLTNYGLNQISAKN